MKHNKATAQPASYVELVYCRCAAYTNTNAEQMICHHMQFKPGMTVLDVLQQFRIYEIYPETKPFKLGIFSQLVELGHKLKPMDRLEIYNPLQLDPMQKRRKRAEQS